jgi:hypothetical protein
MLGFVQKLGKCSDPPGDAWAILQFTVEINKRLVILSPNCPYLTIDIKLKFKAKIKNTNKCKFK